MAKRTPRPGRTLLVFLISIAVLYGLAAIGGTWKPRLGLDLEGGTRITLSAVQQGGQSITPTKLKQAANIVDRRVNGSGVSEAEVSTQGNRNIIVEIPGKNASSLVEAVKRTAQLRFRIVAGSPQPGIPAASPSPSPSGSPSPSSTASPKASPKATPTPKAGKGSATPNPRPAPFAQSTTTRPARPRASSPQARPRRPRLPPRPRHSPRRHRPSRRRPRRAPRSTTRWRGRRTPGPNGSASSPPTPVPPPRSRRRHRSRTSPASH